MTDTPSVAGMIPPRSAGVLMDHVFSHACAPTATGQTIHRRMFDQNSVLKAKPKYGGGAGPGGSLAGGASGGLNQSVYPYPEEDDEDFSNYDTVKDWIACFGAFIIIACSLGLLQNYAVFAPAVQHVYKTGYAEASAVGVFCYTIFVLFLPVASVINKALKHRWTTLFGLLLVFIGLLLDAMSLGIGTLYASHCLFLAIGASLAYGSAMSVATDRFRKKLGLALALLSCAGSFGTLLFYLLSNFIVAYISYMWCKLCLAVIVLICMSASQTFPTREEYISWVSSGSGKSGFYRSEKSAVKDCLAEYAKKKEAGKSGDDVPHKSILCVCVCDISAFGDLSFMLWAVLNLIAVSTIYIPYIGLVSASYEVGQSSALALVGSFCLASIVARFALIISDDHSFRRARILFCAACAGHGFLYIGLGFVQTPGWLLIWAILAGALEGILCVAVPRLTVHTVPFKWLATAWTVVVIFHGIGTPIGALMHVFFYHAILTGAPAWVALAVAQFIAAILSFLLPNELAPMREAFDSTSAPHASSAFQSSFNHSSFGGKSTGPTSPTLPILPCTFTSLNDMKSSNDASYTSNCPICSKIGCIPGCCPDCVPGGLTTAFPSSGGYRASGLSSSYYSGQQRSYLSGSTGLGYTSGLTRANYSGVDCKDFIAQMNNLLGTPNKPSDSSNKNSVDQAKRKSDAGNQASPSAPANPPGPSEKPKTGSATVTEKPKTGSGSGTEEKPLKSSRSKTKKTRSKSSVKRNKSKSPVANNDNEKGKTSGGKSPVKNKTGTSKK